MLKYYQLTFALQVKLGLGKTSKQTDDVWIIQDGDIVKVKASTIKDDTSVRINKNDLNAIRSTYEDQMTKELPKLIHKIYVEFMSVKGNFSYNANEVKLVLMDGNYLTTALDDVQRHVNSNGAVTFANSNKAQKNYLFRVWFHYENPTGKSTEKIGEFFKKLLNSTIAKLAKSIAQLKKETPEANPVDNESAAVLSEIFRTYVPSFSLDHHTVDGKEEPKNFVAMSESERRNAIVKISSDTLHSKLKTAFENGAEGSGAGTDYSGRRDVICAVRDLCLSDFVNAKPELVHIDTIDQMQAGGKGDVTSIQNSFTTVSVDDFNGAIEAIKQGKVEVDSRAPAYRDEKFGTNIGSDRLNTAIFKAITAYNVQTNTSGKKTRKQFSPELEAAFFNPDSESFTSKIKFINKKKTPTSARGEKTANENALVISDTLYESLVDSGSELAEVFENAHSATDYGLLQKGTMYLSSASKLHTAGDSKSVVSAFSVSTLADKTSAENEGSTDHEREMAFNEEYNEFYGYINTIALAIAVYASSVNGTDSKNDHKESDSAVSSNAAANAAAKKAARKKLATKSTASSTPPKGLSALAKNSPNANASPGKDKPKGTSKLSLLAKTAAEKRKAAK